MEKDPVCGMLVRPEEAVVKRSFLGRIYYFCSTACAAKFDKAPQQYALESLDDTQDMEEKRSNLLSVNKIGDVS